MSGKIALIHEYLGVKDTALLEKVMYDVVGISRDDVFSWDGEDPEKTPDVVITIGEQCLQNTCGLKGIMKHAGTQQKFGPFPVIPVVSPTYIEYNPHYLKTFAEHIQTAYHISQGITLKEASNQFIIVKDLDTLGKVVQYCKQTGYCSFDFESTKLTDKVTFDPDFNLTTLSISFQPGSAYVIPLFHPESPFIGCEGDVVPILQEIFSDPNIIKIAQNGKFDFHCCYWLGITELRGEIWDTMLMHQLIDENVPHNLDYIIKELFPQFANHKSLMGKNWETASLLDLAKYNALDSDLTLRIYFILLDIILQSPELYIMLQNLTLPALKALHQMEETGMHVDKTYLIESIRKVEQMIIEQENLMYDHYEVHRFNSYKDELVREDYLIQLQEKRDKLAPVKYKSKTAQVNQLKRLVQMEEEIAKMKTGELVLDPSKVNFNSPDQLQELLFSKEGFGFDLPKQNFKKLAADSTAGDNLDLIKDKSGFIEELKAYRQLKKVHGTYLTSILEKLDSEHNIHTSFNQHVTITGRLSSNKPNLQNIITRTKYKVVEDAVSYVKKCFIPFEGYTLVQADYSQIELRIIAFYSQEKNMIKIYQNDDDIHEMTAANSRGYTIEEFKKLRETDPKEYKKMRYEAKAENFGFVYGMSAEGFKEYCRTDYGVIISSREAEKRREAYFKKYPGLLQYHSLYINKARKYKYVRTFFGRKTHLPEIDSINGFKRGHSERNAINSPIQGTAGEMTIWALALLHIRLDPRVLIVNSIHDSIMFYIPSEMLDEVLPVIKSTMENLPLKQYFGKEIIGMPIKVEFEKSLESWGDLES